MFFIPLYIKIVQLFCTLQNGKKLAYTIGTTLRNRYGSFLGKEYNINLVEGRSSEFNRTKDTLQLVFAGLFPPGPGEEFMPDLKWQPIPYNYVERSRDKVFNLIYNFITYEVFAMTQ